MLIEGLVARLASGIIAPNAQAAMFALKIAAGHFAPNILRRMKIAGSHRRLLWSNLAISVIWARKSLLASMAEVGIQACKETWGSILGPPYS